MRRWLAVLVLVVGCGLPYRIDHRVSPTPDALPRAAYLKVHLRNGDLYLFQSWTQVGQTLVGRGERFGPDRAAASPIQAYQLDLADIALYETDRIVESPLSTGMRVATVASAALSVAGLVFLVWLVNGLAESSH